MENKSLLTVLNDLIGKKTRVITKDGIQFDGVVSDIECFEFEISGAKMKSACAVYFDSDREKLIEIPRLVSITEL